MQQSIHQENQKKIKRGKLAGAALGAAGLILFILALATSAGSFTPLALLGLAMAAAGGALFLVKWKAEKAYAKYLEQEANRPKSAAEKLAQQQAEAVEAAELHKDLQDIATVKKSHVGLGALGAAIGCLLGALIWSCIMGEGYITVFGGIIMILLSFGGYKLFSWNMGTDGMAVSAGMCALMLPFATYGGFIWYLRNNLTFSGYRSLSFAEKWQQTWGMLREYEIMGDFFKCIGNGYVFMLVAGIAVYSLLRRFEK